MFPLKDQPTQTLKELRDTLDFKAETTTVDLGTFKLNFTEPTGHPTIGWKTKRGKKVEVPATQSGYLAVGNLLGVPGPFLKKVDDEVRQTLLEMLIARRPGDVLVRSNDDGLVEVNKITSLIIDPRRLVDAASHVIDPLANVVNSFYEPGMEFRADIIVPEDFNRGIGGDIPTKRSKAVGDITRGGIRIGADLQHHTSPWVSQFLYRLLCTNGLEHCDESQWKIDARGQTVEDVLREFEAKADAAFRTVEETISAHYDLRNEPVDNPERAILGVAREQKLNDKTTLRLTRAAASSDLPDDPTMFDIVNLITNQANDPELENRPDVQRVFQQAGGTVVGDHAARCGHCRARLN